MQNVYFKQPNAGFVLNVLLLQTKIMKHFYSTLLLLISPFLMLAQNPCALDATFATGGKLVSTGSRMAQELLIQPDGKIIIGMEPFGSTNVNLRIRRLNDDGTIDNTFGTGGTTVIEVGERATRIKDMKFYNGNIYIAGTTSTDVGGTTTYVYFAALDANGHLISSFGTNGIKSFRYSPYKLYTVGAMDIDANGNIYAAGLKTSSTYYALKLSAATGSLLSNFDGDGFLDISAPTNYKYEVQDLKLDKQGKIVIAGSSYKYLNNVTSEYRNLVMRLNDNGTFDNTFNSTGRNVFYLNNAATYRAYKLLINAENDYFLTGYVYENSDFDYAVNKVNNNGQQDISFGNNGWQTHDLSGNNVTDGGYNASLLPDENILISGNHGTGDTVYFSMLMLHPDGTRDLSFATNGYFKNIFNQNNNSSSSGLAIDPAGKILLGGYTRTCANGICGPLYMAMSRYTFDIGAPLSITSSIKKESITLYPNPISEEQILQIQGADDINDIKVYSFIGSLIPTTFNKKDRTLRLDNLSAGTYFVSIKHTNQVVAKKLLIK